MSGKLFLKNRLPVILLNLLGALALSLFLLAVGNDIQTVLFILTVWMLVLALYLAAGYASRKKRLEKLLTDRGVSVTMTRTGGGAVSLARRCEIANSIPDLDLFVSLHSNAAAGGGWSSAKGWSVYLYGPGGDRERAAQDILEQVRAAGIAVRSTPIVYDPELYVLKHTKAPAVLLENGFHTNREEAALLGQADYRQKLAVAEAKGILEYLGIPWVETEEETDYQAEARAAVDWLTENGIMQGNAEGDLMLDQPLTRRQFAVLEYRIAKLEGFV